MENISINNGYWQTKVITPSKRFKFDSMAMACVDGHSNGVNINGTNYIVSEGRRDISLSKSSNEVQLACISMALDMSKVEKCNVVTSLPYVIYVNDNERNMYEEKIRENTKVDRVITYIEGAAAQLADIGWYKNKLVALHDIGGLTINTMIFENGKLVEGTADSFNMGTIILDNKIKTSLKSKMCRNYTDYQIPYLFSTQDIDIQKIIEEEVDKHFQEFFQELKKKGYPDRVDRRFTGGGALRLQEYIKKNGWYIGEEPQWENALGQYLFGVVKFK